MLFVRMAPAYPPLNSSSVPHRCWTAVEGLSLVADAAKGKSDVMRFIDVFACVSVCACVCVCLCCVCVCVCV